jgi:hypothetical protein
MQADQAWVALLTAASFKTSLAMSLVSVAMPASAPYLYPAWGSSGPV